MQTNGGLWTAEAPKTDVASTHAIDDEAIELVDVSIRRTTAESPETPATTHAAPRMWIAEADTHAE